MTSFEKSLLERCPYLSCSICSGLQSEMATLSKRRLLTLKKIRSSRRSNH